MKPNLSGMWRADFSKCKINGPLPSSIEVTIRHAEPRLDVEMAIANADGTEDRLKYSAVTTGEQVVNEMRGVQMRSRARWIGEELEIESWASVGAIDVHFRDYWSVASDGRTLVMEHRDDDLAGQRTVLEKADSPAVAPPK